MKKDPQQLIKDIRTYCVKHSNPVIVQKYSRYFKEGYDAYGLTEELLHTKVKELLDTYCAIGLKGFLDAGDLLFVSGKYEEGSFAILLVQSFKTEFNKSVLQRFGKWLEKVQNWAHCDIIGSYLISPMLVGKTASVQDMSKWRESTFKFKRRSVPVSLIPLVKADDADHLFYLDFIEPMMMDKERVVHQGMGWFLRETWKRNPEPVEEFLMKWKDQSARLIFQYATEKMKPADKLRFRKNKQIV